MKHGANRYRAAKPYRCRCEICTREHAAWQARERQALAARLAEMPAVNHGTTGGYENWGCRCPECTRAATEARRARRRRLQETS